VKIHWVKSDDCETEAGALANLSEMDGICVPGGFGVRGIEGKLGAIKFARENKIPLLGLCLGLQCMVIEYARSVVGLEGATSSEFEPSAKHPVIATMAEQVSKLENSEMGGTMRLGLYEASLQDGSIVQSLYGAKSASERHRHRYEVNNHYRDQIAEKGLVFSGTSPDRHLVEYVELPKSVHPFFVGTQAHPEFRSRPTKPNPLFFGLIQAAIERKQAQRLFNEG
jgi:CTP synthase